MANKDREIKLWGLKFQTDKKEEKKFRLDTESIDEFGKFSDNIKKIKPDASQNSIFKFACKLGNFAFENPELAELLKKL